MTKNPVEMSEGLSGGMRKMEILIASSLFIWKMERGEGNGILVLTSSESVSRQV
jgi:hypothetical protein